MTRGIDITDDIATKSCMVVAPHSDDETLGGGVAIVRKREAWMPRPVSARG
jgi:hypothetical protein